MAQLTWVRGNSVLMAVTLTQIKTDRTEEPIDLSVYDAWAVRVLHVNVNTDHLARNPYYPDRADTALGTVGEVSFDVITLTDDDKLVCTRIGYYDGTVCPFFNEQGERVFRLTPLDPDDDTGIVSGLAE